VTASRHAASYTATSDQVARLSETLLAQWAPPAQAALSCHRVAGDSPFGVLARALEARQLASVGYTPDLVAEEYAPYEEASSFVIVLDVAARRPVAEMRVLTGVSQTAADLIELGRSDAAAALQGLIARGDVSRDIGTGGVDPDYHDTHLGTEAVVLAIRCLARDFIAQDVRACSALSSTAFLRLLRRIGFPLRLLDGAPVPFLGAMFQPWWARMDEIEPASTARARSLQDRAQRSDIGAAFDELARLTLMVGTGEGADALIDPIGR
jgi:hypothetical protein